MRFQNGSNKVVIELQVVQFWFEIILVISNRTRAAPSFDFEITRMISDQIVRPKVQSVTIINQLLEGFAGRMIIVSKISIVGISMFFVR